MILEHFRKLRLTEPFKSPIYLLKQVKKIPINIGGFIFFFLNVTATP